MKTKTKNITSMLKYIIATNGSKKQYRTFRFNGKNSTNFLKQVMQVLLHRLDKV